MTIIKRLLLLVVVLTLVLMGILFLGSVPKNENISWGVAFSTKYAEDLGFEWEDVYRSLIEDFLE